MSTIASCLSEEQTQWLKEYVPTQNQLKCFDKLIQSFQPLITNKSRYVYQLSN